MITETPFKHSCIKISATLWLFVLLMTACKEQEKKDIKAIEATTSITADRFIEPPIKSADVPYKEYEVDAAKGDTLLYPTGSIILFPPNAFVDEAGKPVTGKVQVKYREFKDPVDFFLAGIPMQYDSAGTAYQFISSGMLDIRAFKDGKPVFVNKAAKPEINLASKDNSNKHSLYFLDTVQQKWINKGGMQITERRAQKKENPAAPAVALNELPEPVKPLKADNKSPVLKIEVDPSSFKEFALYKNLKFQVDESKTPFNVKDSEEEWNNLELLKGAQPGSYLAKFSNAGKSATYAVKPVLEGAEYEKALQVFEKELAEYKKQAAERAVKDKAAREKYMQDMIEDEQIIAGNRSIQRLNAIIAEKNLEIEKENQRIAKINDETSKQNEIIAKKNVEILEEKERISKRNRDMEKEIEAIELEKKKIIADVMARASVQAKAKTVLSDVYRSFQIDGFGFWNCDVAAIQNTVSVQATFKDEKGNVLELTHITIINSTQNSMLQVSPNNLRFVPNTDNMILAIHKNVLVYLSYSSFRKLKINDYTKQITLIMKIVTESDLNYEYIRGALKQ